MILYWKRVFLGVIVLVIFIIFILELIFYGRVLVKSVKYNVIGYICGLIRLLENMVIGLISFMVVVMFILVLSIVVIVVMYFYILKYFL